MSMIDPADYVTTADAARQLHVSTIRVRQFCQQERLASEKIAGRWLIPKKDLDSFKKKVRRPGRVSSQE